MDGKRAPEPWVYRMKEFDDWGLIRDANGLPVASARDCEADLQDHRAAGTDPYKETGSRIVKCVNACAGWDNPTAEAIKAAREALELMVATAKRWGPQIGRDGDAERAALLALAALGGGK